MRLGLKLIALGIILLLPKTHLYLSEAHLPEAQTASERQMLSPAAHWDVSSAGCFTVSAAKTSKCAAKPGHDGSDTVAIHAMDKSPKGS
ncbi:MULTISPECIES: hypothetical protein [Bradyrhizobium]|uniref:hypothetical protein n=1 Tax=Bradyrhizobium TaxID=374 RepID=UPI001B89F22E|nr:MULTISPECIES: hypothetical protein [Bradyrhizobium]MBR0971243.1 hypothetical protein [Bradyrhizobium japonicum]